MSIRLKIFSPYFSYWIVSTNNVSTTILALLRKMMISIENFDGNNVTPCYKNITPIFFLLDTGDLKQSKMECLRYIIDKNTFFLLEELKSFFYPSFNFLLFEASILNIHDEQNIMLLGVVVYLLHWTERTRVKKCIPSFVMIAMMMIVSFLFCKENLVFRRNSVWWSWSW